MNFVAKDDGKQWKNKIQFEYDNSQKDHMEIEIGESDVAEVFIVKYNGEEAYEKIKAEAGEINKRVCVFMEHTRHNHDI